MHAEGQVCSGYNAIGSTGKPDKVATGLRHGLDTAYGGVSIRVFTIIQLLLGNMGLAGGA